MNTFCTLFQKMSIATYKPTTVGADATGYVWFLCQIHIIVSYRKPRTYTVPFVPTGTGSAFVRRRIVKLFKAQQSTYNVQVSKDELGSLTL